MSTATADLLRYFRFEHLPERLQLVSAPCAELAETMAERLPEDHPQLLAGLQHLLDARGCFERAALD